MKEQMNVIAEALEGRNTEWNAAFCFKQACGEHTYDIVIERKKNRLELTAKFPIQIDKDNSYSLS